MTPPQSPEPAAPGRVDWRALADAWDTWSWSASPVGDDYTHWTVAAHGPLRDELPRTPNILRALAAQRPSAASVEAARRIEENELRHPEGGDAVIAAREILRLNGEPAT